MKLFNKVLASSVALSSFAALASDDATSIHQVIAGKERIKMAQAYKAHRKDLYFVRFQDAPLAEYGSDGSNLMAVSGNKSNAYTSSGVLNTKSASAVAYKSFLTSKQNSAVSTLSSKLKRPLSVKQRYNVILNAVTVELQPHELATVENDPSVKSIERVGLHYIQSDTGPSHVQAQQVWNSSDTGVQTQGEGVIVGILDTGINATHPSFADIGGDGYDHTNPLGENNYLGDCVEYAKFCNDKLIGIISYPEITDNYGNITNDTEFDDIDDKIKVGYDFHGHGSHVASTAAGNILKDVNYYLSVQDDVSLMEEPSAFEFEQISGVAPHANIVSYQVCNYAGACYPELSILAIEHAIENGIDVINYSVGGSARDPWQSIDGEAFLNARRAGIHVATSAGNSGPGAETIGSPGNAPWITTVAAYTHGRSFTSKSLTAFSGGESTPTEMTGEAATAGYTGNVVLASDYGDALCSNEFAENTFDGEIVVCERGAIARVRKGINVSAGGAGGMILVNVDPEVDTTDKDNHVLPAIHIDVANGETLLDWLATGTDHQVTITPSQLEKDEDAADIAGVFSSRGPNIPFPGVFGPDIAAPGVEIYAANAEDRPFDSEGGNIPYTIMSGTSMSSPHVAGTLALIHAAKPDWTPAQVQSALMTTAHRVTYTDDDFDGEKTRSTFFDQGAGSARVFDALNAGLLLDVSYDDYINAQPDQGGDTNSLNTSSVALVECLGTCTWTRTVTATQDSTWNASYEYLQPGFAVTVSPSQFSLSAGESRELTFSTEANENLRDEWVNAYVVFTPTNSAISPSHFQAAVNFNAGRIEEEVSATVSNEQREVVIEDVLTIGSDQIQKAGFGLYAAQTRTGEAIGSSNDSERNAFYLYPEVYHSESIVVKPYTKKLVVELVSTPSPDMDLYVGIDEDADGKPSAVEMYYSLLCISGNIDSNEKCVIDLPPTGNYWIVAHNYAGTSEETTDTVELSIAQIGFNYEPSFDINAPETVAKDELFDVSLNIKGALDDDENSVPVLAGQTYYGLLELGTSQELKRNIGKTIVKVTSESDFVNRAPVYNGPASLSGEYLREQSFMLNQDLSQWFTEPDGNTMTFTLADEVDGVSIEDGVLMLDVAEAMQTEMTLIASDGETSVEVVIELSVTPGFENNAPTVGQHESSVSASLNDGEATALINIANWFTDQDGDALTYRVTGNGSISLNGTSIFATYTQAGSYTITVWASDGLTEVSTNVTVTVEAPKKSSGGAFGGFALLLSLLAARVRSKRH